MHPTRLLFREAYQRTPMIKFLGKRVAPKTITPAAPATEPAVHPASPSDSLPESFMSYRSRALQHGPLAGQNRPSSSPSASSAPPPSSSSYAYGAIGGLSGHALGGVEPERGEVWDRSELPARFGRMAWTEEEIEGNKAGGERVFIDTITMDKNAFVEKITYLNDGYNTFSLDQLDKETLSYEESHYSQDSQIKDLDDKNGETLKMIANDKPLVKPSKADGLPSLLPYLHGQIAKADIISRQLTFRGEVVLHYLRQAQLFNIEKRFGSVEEHYLALENDDAKRAGNPHLDEYELLSVRQERNNPKQAKEVLKVVELIKAKPPAIKAQQKQSLAKALAQHKRLIKAATREIAAIKETAQTAETRMPPQLPSNLELDGITVPSGVSHEFRRCIFDLQYLRNETGDLNKQLLEQHGNVRSIMMHWMESWRAVWKPATQYVHEIKVMREYEYGRASLLATCWTAMREEDKIYNCGKPQERNRKLKPKIKAGLAVGTKGPKIKKALSVGPKVQDTFWNHLTSVLSKELMSVDDLIVDAEKMRAFQSRGGWNKPEIHSDMRKWAHKAWIGPIEESQQTH